jgi:branched-chain amino acid transport system ATP-binding protein
MSVPAVPLLAVDHLTMRFGGLAAVNDVSFEVRKGEITAVIGPNGAGKTTLFNCLTGFYRPRIGRMTLTVEGGNYYLLERMEGFRIAREARVVRTFQTTRLFAGMSVLENLMVAQYRELMPASKLSLAGLSGIGFYRRAYRRAGERALYWLERVGLLEAANNAAGTLAYGHQRRLEIARAMCSGPRLLCIDEPAAGLNRRESEQLNALLLEIKRQHDVAVLLIEHDMRVVMQISDHIVVLDHGVCIADGTPQEVRADPAVIGAYLGTVDTAVVLPARGDVSREDAC